MNFIPKASGNNSVQFRDITPGTTFRVSELRPYDIFLKLNNGDVFKAVWLSQNAGTLCHIEANHPCFPCEVELKEV